MLFSDNIIIDNARNSPALLESLTQIPRHRESNVVGITLLECALIHIAEVVIGMRRIEIDQRIGKTEFEVQLVVTGALSNRNIEIRVLHMRITEFISLGSKVGTQRIHPSLGAKIAGIEGSGISPTLGWND